jgi:Spy/CpxP family protein refolding chaperone
MTLSLVAASAIARPAGHHGGGGGLGWRTGGGGTTFPAEYQEMVDVAKFTAVQKESLRKLLLDYDKAIKSNDSAKLDAAKAQVNANTDEEHKAADAKMKAVAAQRDAIEHTLDLKAFEIMTPEQRTTWTGYVLEKVFTDELSDLDPKLDDTQKISLKAVCQTAGDKSPSPDAANDTKLLDSVRKTISEKVLTDKQRTNYETLLDAKDKAKEEKQKKGKPATDKPKDTVARDKPSDAVADDKPRPTDAGAGATTKSTGPLKLDIPQP